MSYSKKPEPDIRTWSYNLVDDLSGDVIKDTEMAIDPDGNVVHRDSMDEYGSIIPRKPIPKERILPFVSPEINVDVSSGTSWDDDTKTWS